MTRKRVYVFILLLAVFAVSFFILTFDLLGEKTAPEVYNIAVIIRGKNSDTWQNIRQGAEQAASELFVDLSFITLSEENNLEEQIYLLEREYLSGAAAIILSAADSAELVDPVEAIADKIPVVCIESPVNTSKLTSYVATDDYAMGVELARHLLDANSRKRIAIMNSSPHCDNIRQRLDGMLSVLGPDGVEPAQWALPNNADEAAMQMAMLVDKGEADVLVALDTTTLELAGQIISDISSSNSIELFGFSASGKVASFLEKDVVRATIVKNDFAIGHQAVQAAVNALKKQRVPPVILVDHRLITRDNMYDIENQRLLFPFIR